MRRSPPRSAPRPDAPVRAGLAVSVGSGVLASLTLLAALTVVADPAGAAPAPPPPAATDPLGADPAAGADEPSLALARDREAQATAAVDTLKLALRPGHLADPMPGIDRSYGLEMLRAELSEMERKAAGYRATLGSQHPTLAAADQVIADLRGQLLDATRKALAGAERDAAAARTAVAGAERDPARSLDLTDVTGAIAPVREPSRPSLQQPSRPSLQEPSRVGQELSRRAARAEAVAGPKPATAAVLAEGRQGSSTWILVAAALSGLLALLSAGWASRQLLRTFRRPPRSRFTLHRREPGLVPGDVRPPAAALSTAPSAVPAATSLHAPSQPDVPPSRQPSRPTATRSAAAPAAALAAAPAVALAEAAPPLPGRAGPVDVLAALATLPLSRTAMAADLVGTVAVDPGGPLALAAARLYAGTLALAGGSRRGRLSVLVTGVGEARDADADLAALALALAATASGRRVALMEARRVGRLRRDLVPAQARPALIEAGGAVRTLYRLGTPFGTLSVLPGDASEAALAALPSGAARQRGFDAFDLVVMVGEDLPTLVQGADLVVVAAAPSGSEDDVAKAARLCRAAGRPCGGVVVERPAAVAVAAPRPVAVGAARRRAAGPQPARSGGGRLQLRGTLEPLRQAAG